MGTHSLLDGRFDAIIACYTPHHSLSPKIRWEGDKGMVDMRRRLAFRSLEAAGAPPVKRFGIFPPFPANRPRRSAPARRLKSLPACRPFPHFQLFGAVAP